MIFFVCLFFLNATFKKVVLVLSEMTNIHFYTFLFLYTWENPPNCVCKSVGRKTCCIQNILLSNHKQMTKGGKKRFMQYVPLHETL